MKRYPKHQAQVWEGVQIEHEQVSWMQVDDNEKRVQMDICLLCRFRRRDDMLIHPSPPRD